MERVTRGTTPVQSQCATAEAKAGVQGKAEQTSGRASGGRQPSSCTLEEV